MGNPHVSGADQTGCASISTFYNPSTWIEGRAEDQLNQVSTWPGMISIAAFPDLHPGRFGPVGAAFLADRIYPQLVGPDIGCGMALFRLDLPRRKLKIDKAARRLRSLEDGLDTDDALAALAGAGLTEGSASPDGDTSLPSSPTGASLTYGLGSIGGGNHFCEVQVVQDTLNADQASLLGFSKGDLCLLVHSGSRNLGACVFNGIDETWREGFLPDSEAAVKYLALHDVANRWAALNRLMIGRIAAEALRCDVELICDAVHNNVEALGSDWLHRKGAASPDKGLAPLAGSRDSLSYLLATAGIANGAPQNTAMPAGALNSLSHGAGRRYDRASMHGRIAKTKSGMAAMQKTRFGGTVVCENPDLMIEEAGHAYKNAAAVVADLEQFGIARPIASLAPLITYKTARTGDAP
jgi:release factor H-coupled RctB family protein